MITMICVGGLRSLWMLLLFGAVAPEASASHASSAQNEDLVLTKKILRLSETAAELSILAYEEDPPRDPKYTAFAFYDAEPDQALLVQEEGHCFVAFRGTTLTADDWSQNLLLGDRSVCHDIAITDDVSETECCDMRRGFYEAYNTNYAPNLTIALRECYQEECAGKNKEDCFILTGHSQGGAIAAVAALYVYDLDPLVITFGQPPTLKAPCHLISSSRWYRYVNTNEQEDSITYDPVPFLPGLGADQFGHMILLSQRNASTVAYVGLDARERFRPLDVASGAVAHSMQTANETDVVVGEDGHAPCPGYLDRIETLLEQYDSNEKLHYPVIANGYVAGSLCTKNSECQSQSCGQDVKSFFGESRCVGTECEEDADCTTGRCDSGLCIPKAGSCAVCDEDSDCISGTCWTFTQRCTGTGGLMDNECTCYLDSDCRSGRCEGVFNPICEAPLADGSYCNENSDCESGRCSFKLRCTSSGWWWSMSREQAENEEQTKRGDAPVSSPSNAGEKLRVSVLMVIVLAAILLLVYWFREYRKHRGYQQIPADLNV